MKCVLKLRTVISFSQYISIFFMLMIHGAAVYRYEIKQYETILSILFVLLIAFQLKKMPIKSIGCFSFVILSFVLWQRFWTDGGVGVYVYLKIMLFVYCTYFAVFLDKRMFLTRYVMMVYYLAIISVFFFLFGVVSISTVKALCPITYESEYYLAWQYYTNGLYSFLDSDSYRNSGMFTEPGLYQMILNSILYCILYFRENIYLSTRKINKIMVVVILTLFTTQSTTGYIGGCFILIAVLIEHSEKFVLKTKKVFKLIFPFIGIITILDVATVGFSQELFSVISEKFLTDAGEISLSTSTGRYRILLLAAAWNVVKTNPLGIGYTEVAVLLRSMEGVAGAEFAKYVMAMGVVFVLYVLTWYFYPVVKYKKSNVELILVISLYFNTVLGQSEIFYPSLVLVPIIMRVYRQERVC